MSNSKRDHSIIACVLALVLSVLPAQYGMARTAIAVGFNGTHDTNPALTETNKSSNTTHALFATLSGQYQGARLNSFADVRAGYEDGNRSDGRLTGSGGAMAEFILRPKRFHWVFRDTLTHTLIDFLESGFDPDNSQLRNTFSTGPQLFFDLTPRNRLNLSGEFSRTTHDESSISDTEDWVGAADFEHDISERSQSGLTYSYRESEQVEGMNVSTEIENAAVYFRTQLRRQVIHAEIGAGRDIGSDFETGTGSIRWNFQLNSRLSLSASAGKSLSTASAEADNDFVEQTLQFNLTSAFCNAGILTGSSCTLVNRLNDANRLASDGFLRDEDLAQALFEDSSRSLEIQSSSIALNWLSNGYSSYVLSYSFSDQQGILPSDTAALREADSQESQSIALVGTYLISERYTLDVGITQTIRENTMFDSITQAKSQAEFTERMLRMGLAYRLARDIESRFGLHFASADRESNESLSDAGGDGFGLEFMVAWAF